jgi:hypothetical protein
MLRLTATGSVFVPGVAAFCTLTTQARAQLAGLVGVDLDKLVEAVVPGDRAQLAFEANQRLHGVPADVRVQIEAETTADGVVVTDVSPVTKTAATLTTAA